MAAHLGPYARLTARRDDEAMTRAILDVAANPRAARADASRGREYVRQHWSRARAFEALRLSLSSAAGLAPAAPTKAAA